VPFSPIGQGGVVTFDVLVQPRASRDRIGPVHEDRLKVAVTAAPTEGEANRAVVAALAQALGVPRSAITIVRGQSSRRKTVSVSGATAQRVLALAGGE
jgi:uncharacterized protein (TIGR00251 family)